MPCLRLFHDTVHRVNTRDYSQSQVDAWSPVNKDHRSWASRFKDRIAFVAWDDDTIVGFCDMTRQGHLDRLFVSADHQRQGIGRLLLETLIDEAEAAGIGQLTTDASITARPFFARMGFEVVRGQCVDCGGVTLKNFLMRRSLTTV